MKVEELKDRLRGAMKAAGIGSTALAKTVGVAPETVSRWLSGERHPSRERLKLVAAALGTTAAYLLEGKQLPDTLQAWHQRFAELILNGVDPDQALDIVTRRPHGLPLEAGGGETAAVLTAAERDLLRAAGRAMRADLAERSGGRWGQLSEEQQQAILREIERLAGGDAQP